MTNDMAMIHFLSLLNRLTSNKLRVSSRTMHICLLHVHVLKFRILVLVTRILLQPSLFLNIFIFFIILRSIN